MSDVNTTAKSTSNDGAAAVVNTSFNRFNILNVLFYILNSIATYSVQFGWVNLPTNGDLSDKYQTIVTPFGKSFLIWSIIFMWQLFWVVWQLLPSQRNSEGVLKAWYFYPIFSICQAGWTFSFSTEVMWLSLVFMYGILITLVSASMSLQTYKKTWKGYLIWQGPFSIQTGWIMAASVLNTNVLPVFYEATATTRMVVASLSLAVLVITAFTWLSSYPVDFAIPCVILWALGFIYAELNAPLLMITDMFSTRQISGVQSAVLAGMGLVGVGILSKALYVLVKQRPQAQKAQRESAKQISSDSEKEEASAASIENSV